MTGPIDDCARAGQKLRQRCLPHRGPTRSTWSVLTCAQHRLGLPHGLAESVDDWSGGRAVQSPALVDKASGLLLLLAIPTRHSQHHKCFCHMLYGRSSMSIVYASLSCLKAGLQQYQAGRAIADHQARASTSCSRTSCRLAFADSVHTVVRPTHSEPRYASAQVFCTATLTFWPVDLSGRPVMAVAAAVAVSCERLHS